jgi:hypothetical protein
MIFISIQLNSLQRSEKKSYEKAKLKSLQFLYYLQTELDFNTYGLSENEFPTTDGFPLIPYHRESRRIRGITTLTLNHIARPYNQARPIYKTGIAVGDYPVDHHHASHPNAKGLPKLHFYPVSSYNVPMGCLIPQNIENFIVAEKSISVTNIVNGTTRLQPVVLQIGQAAGLIAAQSIKQNITPAAVQIRTIQSQLLEEGAYLLPYLDVPKDHSRFKVYQRIGSTGIMKGTGMNVGWENQTWFFDKKEMTQSDMDHALSQLRKFKKVQSPLSLNNQDIRKWFIELRQTFLPNEPLPLWIKDLNALGDFLEYEMPNKSKINRGDFALMLDTLIDPFHTQSINFYGHFISTDR